MAQDPTQISPTGSNAANANYTHGSARNVSSPGAGDGYPWLAAVVNQFEAFFQRMMDEAGLSYNGTVDTVPASQFYTAAQTLFAGSLTLIDSVSPTGVASFTVTGIPPEATLIMITHTDVDYSVSSRLECTLHDDGVEQTTGYRSTIVQYDQVSTTSIALAGDHFIMNRPSNVDGTSVHSGVAFLMKNNTTGRWSWVGNARGSDFTDEFFYQLSQQNSVGPVIVGDMDQLTFRTLSGTIEAGTISVYAMNS